jgi:hypothetical protein
VPPYPITTLPVDVHSVPLRTAKTFICQMHNMPIFALGVSMPIPGTYKALLYMAEQTYPESETLVFVILKQSPVSVDQDLQPPVNFRWIVSPNPATGIVPVAFQGNPNSSNSNIVQIKDLMGNLLLEKTVDNGDFSVDMTNFNAGVYVMNIANGEVKTSIKIVKIP